MEKAIFAGGCFWCMVHPFEEVDGVLSVVSGYTGGTVPNPTYESVCGSDTGHREAVEITFDPKRVSYETLLDIFWRQIDPTDPGGQFADRGTQYRSAIFVTDDRQRRAAEASRERLAASGRFAGPIVTDILPAAPFYAAEDYHQGYHHKNPERYRRYRLGSGREFFLSRHWSAHDDQ